MAMVHFDDFNIPILAEPLRRLLHQMRQHGDTQRGIAGLQHGNMLGRAIDQPVMALLKAGGADDDRDFGGDCGVQIGLQRNGRRKIDQHIACCRERAYIIALIGSPAQCQASLIYRGDQGLAHTPFAADNANACHIPIKAFQKQVDIGNKRFMEIRNIVILTGAGASAESGIDTFRSEGGLWERYKVDDVATPQAFQRDPDLVLGFYDMRRAAIQHAEPNAAHRALARLDAAWPGQYLIVTQNVDDLHERAGAKRVLHMHGQHLSAWCMACDSRPKWCGTLAERPECPACGVAGALRPDIVWFGEPPYQMERIHAAIADCDLFVSIGTSGAVYPAAGLVRHAQKAGAVTLELNLEPSKRSHYFDECRYGTAGQLVPDWVDEILGRG